MEKSINIDMINDCIAGNRQAQRRLYDMLMPFLNMTCRRYLNDQASTQDVLQETFLSIFTNLRQFDPAKSALKTWATRITINFCLKNNAKYVKMSEIEWLPELHDHTILPEVLQNLSDEALLDFLKTMPRSFFEVFNLYVIDGFTHEEIGEILNIETALSRQRLARGREWLREKGMHQLIFSVN